MKEYRNIQDEKLEEVVDILRQIIRFRNTEDISDFNNLNKRFFLGRKVNKVPTSSSDVVVGQDFVGDININANFIYTLIDNSGTIEWRRAALSSF